MDFECGLRNARRNPSDGESPQMPVSAYFLINALISGIFCELGFEGDAYSRGKNWEHMFLSLQMAKQFLC